ncbi:hypothetical protein D7V86_10470 [bacterium D16-51]|nr:hypothetical protein D7V96_10505 [bacterium D16-59]RKI60076.1 hypothetical protein D7V86_10470 [bacterium D16-51]
MKAACPVWSGGKGGDNFKALPIAILPLYKDAERRRHRPDRSPEIERFIYEMPLSGRNHRQPWRSFRNRNARRYTIIILKY